METMSFRYDESIKEELLFIQSLQNASRSQVVKEAIHAYYLTLKEQEEKSTSEIFKKSKFIGCFKGDEDLSVEYKSKLTKDIKKKHGKK